MQHYDTLVPVPTTLLILPSLVHIHRGRTTLPTGLGTSMTGFGPPPQREITEEYLQEDNGRILVGVSVGCAAATTVILGSRFYSKRLGGAPLGLDDVFLTAAYVVNLGMCALALGLC